jgi:uncharacterized protein
MLVEQMTDSQCDELLDRMHFGRLGCVHENRPYVVPIYFAYEPGRLYGFSTLGRKIEWMRSNPHVCVEVDDVLGAKSWNCVIIDGQYEELSNEPRYLSARKRAYELLDRRFLGWQAAYAAEQLRHASQPSPTILYCIRIEEMSGRSSRPDLFDAAPAQQRMSL